MEVYSSFVYSALQRADAKGNGDGQYSREEVAQAALSSDPESKEYSLLYTMVAGGKDKKGLFPDGDGNGLLSKGELNSLAKQDGKGDSFSTNDFSKMFGDRAQSTTVSTYESQKTLRNIAGGNGGSGTNCHQQLGDMTSQLFSFANCQFGQWFGNGQQQQQPLQNDPSIWA